METEKSEAMTGTGMLKPAFAVNSVVSEESHFSEVVLVADQVNLTVLGVGRPFLKF